MWRFALAYVAAVSFVAFMLALLDKRAARKRRPRVPERVLLGTALVGGSPGLILAMLAVRHKTRKRSFLAPLVVILVIQLGLLAWAFVEFAFT